MRISEIIVVEGRDDTQAVKRAVECETIETHGFGIRASVWQSLERAYKAKGLIIFTDPDHAGDTIRRKIKERFPDCKEAFLPRPKADRDGDIGVENARPEDIREALMKARPCPQKCGADESGADEIKWSMITSAGLTGDAGSRARREALAEELGIACGNARSMLSHMNAFGITAGEFHEAVRAIDNKADKE